MFEIKYILLQFQTYINIQFNVGIGNYLTFDLYQRMTS
jgi:hypothetical protein